MKTKYLNSLKIGIIAIIILSANIFQAIAQAPGIEWQNTIGGTGFDDLKTLSRTPDGGFILSVITDSGISGDKTEASNGAKDIWILKLDASGNIEWQNTIGGSEYDYVFNIIATTDGGYIIGGSSNSGISGDKTEAAIGAFDYWVIKLNTTGDIMWENTIGGTGEDDMYTIIQTSDGGYLLGGISVSGISGDKTEVALGLSDYWIVKINDVGNIEWQNTIGGNGVDDLFQIRETNDGGFILGGYSGSGISGDKTESCAGVVDYWVVKTDEFGNIMWQNTIGGNAGDYLNSIFITEDNGYLLGGYSSSVISGDKTETNMGGDDYWIIKLNSEGDIEWQNTIGGGLADIINVIAADGETGYLLGGTSLSGISGDKSENREGHLDYWIVRIDLSGNIVWQNTLGGTENEYLNALERLDDNVFILGGVSTSGISGNKTEALIGGSDIWVLQLSFAEESCFAPFESSVITLADKAKINWNIITAAIGYKVRYRPVGTELWSVNYVNGKEFNVIKPLDCNTEYEYQILSVCADDGTVISDYSASNYFTTLDCRLSGDNIEPKLLLFPNPASDNINISISGINGDADIQIFDLNGQIVFQNSVFVNTTYQMIWNTEKISNGIYQIRVMTKEAQFTEKIFINN